MEGCPNGIQPLRLVSQGSLIFTSQETWNKSQEVLKAVHTELCWTHTRMWMVWHSDVSSLLSRTSRYSSESLEETSILDVAWNEMVGRSAQVWEKIVNCRSVVSEQLDEWEEIELAFGQVNHDIPDNLVSDADLEVENGPNVEWVHL